MILPIAGPEEGSYILDSLPDTTSGSYPALRIFASSHRPLDQLVSTRRIETRAMKNQWEADQIWSLTAASLKEAFDNKDLADSWKDSFLDLCQQENARKRIEATSSAEVTRVLLHSLGRGHALIKQALDWENPHIGGKDSKSSLDATRGLMWKYAMAYCGWDRSTNSLGITQDTQGKLFAKAKHQIQSPRLTDSQRKRILAWTPEEESIDEQNEEISIDGSWIRDFFGIKEPYRDFPHWLVGEKSMKQAQLLAILRHITCHGSLLPSKAKSWGLEATYAEGITAIAEGFELLLNELLPASASIDKD